MVGEHHAEERVQSVLVFDMKKDCEIILEIGHQSLLHLDALNIHSLGLSRVLMCLLLHAIVPSEKKTQRMEMLHYDCNHHCMAIQ